VEDAIESAQFNVKRQKYILLTICVSAEEKEGGMRFLDGDRRRKKKAFGIHTYLTKRFTTSPVCKYVPVP